MFYWVYVIESRDGRLYVGFSTSVHKRLKEHNQGLNFSTKPYKPWYIVHCELYLNRKDALRRERYLKTSQGSRLLKRMLKEYFYQKKSKNS